MDVQEIKSLIEEQGRLFEQFKTKLTARDAELAQLGIALPETKTAIDAMNARFDEIEIKMKRGLLGQGERQPEQKTATWRATEKLFRFGLKGNAALERMTDDEKAAFADIRTKSLAVSPDTGGGFLVPEDFQTEVIQKIANLAGVGSLVSRITTSRDLVRWPKVNYTTDDISTSGITVTWEDETDTATSTDPSPFGSVSIPVKKVRALVKVARELLEDSAVDTMSLLQGLVADAYSIAEDNVFTVGSGGKKPEGMMTNTDISTTNSGSSGAFTYDGLTNLVYAVPNQYAAGASFMARRSTMALLRQIKDSQNRPIWEPSMQVGTPATMLGYPIHLNEHITAVASGSRSLIFGDYKRLYMAVDKNTMSMQRLDEKYADTDEVGFIFRRRFGGAVVGPWAARIQVLT